MSIRLTIEFETDNDAFVEDPATESVRVLGKVFTQAKRVIEAATTSDSGYNLPIKDENGNTIGRAILDIDFGENDED